MNDPTGYRTVLLLAADLTLQTARNVAAFWDAVLLPFGPLDFDGRLVAATEAVEAQPVESPAPAAPVPPPAAAMDEAPPAPTRRFADLVVYRVEIAFPGPGVALADTFLGCAAGLDAIATLGVTALHLTPRRPGPAGRVFAAAALDSYAVGPDAVAALLPALNAARAAHDAAALTTADLVGGHRQVRCLVDLCHLSRLAVLIDLADDPAAADLVRTGHFDGTRLADPQARANEPGTGRLVWGGQDAGAPAGDDLRLAMRDLLRGARETGGRLSFDALAAGLASAPSMALSCLSDPDDIEDLSVLADPQAPRGWVARSRQRLLTSLLFAAPGAPTLAAGAERFAAGDAAAGRDKAGQDALRFTRETIALRGAEPGLRGAGVRVTRCDPDARVFILHRWVADGSAGRDVIVVANFSGDTLYGYRIGLPRGGWWREIFNSDAFESNFDRPVIGNGGAVDAHDGPLDGFAHSVPMTVPPNAALFFTPCQ